MLWFKHDSNANMDGKLQEVLLDYGLEGYGLYFYCLELIVNKVSVDNITFELEHDSRIIARNTGCTVQKVEEMMKSFIKLGLFSNNSNGRVVCSKLINRMDSSMTSNPKMRNMIKRAKDAHSHDGVMMESDLVMQEENRIEQNRIDKKKDTPSASGDSKKFKQEDHAKPNLSPEAWKIYCKYRRDIKNPLGTERGCNTQSNLLCKFSFEIQLLMVNQTLDNEWTKIVEVKNLPQKSQQYQTAESPL